MKKIDTTIKVALITSAVTFMAFVALHIEHSAQYILDTHAPHNQQIK